jgi:hypothetical protein
MMQASTTMTFPHPELTPIVGTPTNPTIQTIQKQLFANALAIHSARGEGVNQRPSRATYARCRISQPHWCSVHLAHTNLAMHHFTLPMLRATKSPK